MSPLQRQQNPLGIPRSFSGYDSNHKNGNNSNDSNGVGGEDRPHPMDAVYLDDSKTVLIPPYLCALPDSGANNGKEADILSKDGKGTPKNSASSIGGNENKDESSLSAEEADAAAGVSSTATNVLKKVTSLGAIVSSTSLSALTGLASSTSDESKFANSASTPIGKMATDNSFVSPSSPSKAKKKIKNDTMMLHRYYQSSGDLNILNNPNHRNYHHHLFLRNMNVNRPLGEVSSPSSPSPTPSIPPPIKPSWRLRDRMKTVGVGLIMALNVGTDPPDIVKPHPSAKLQCWMDPSSVTRAKAKEKIGDRLEKQYARWQQQRNTSSSSRPFKYRKALDPTVEDVRALCLWLRKQARHERILLHYNGHGVPKPTQNGEIWVFDKNHTEYIPLSVSDLRQWVGKPTIVILDCSSAGVLVPFLTAPPAETPTNTPPRVSSPILAAGGASLEQQQTVNRSNDDIDPVITTMDEAASIWVKDTIVLCPTSEGEWLPMNPEYPADIFTSCLTTPIQMALRWFVRNNRISMGVLFGNTDTNGNENNTQNYNHIGDDGPDISVDSIPGQANDRKTPLGELNWIFTSVTDSIAWNVLPKPLFQRLFRQDLLVASMFRNFLLADRILRSLNCTPQSYPPLPPGVADHPLWQAWDLACETCLFGLIKDGIIGKKADNMAPRPSAGLSEKVPQPHQQHMQQHPHGMKNSPQSGHQFSAKLGQDRAPKSSLSKSKPSSLASSVSSPFFSEQLTGFEVWLEYASIHRGNIDHLKPPEQLPVVLQVLLSQVHRVRALELLRQFLELGPWAVNLALSLGIFPYVMKLLQSAEYKTVLVNIWASILKFDPSCQVDLSKDKSLVHFIQPLAQWSKRTSDGDASKHTAEAAKQRTLIAFCLASVCHKYPNAQTECLRQNLHGHCAGLLVAQIKLTEQQNQQQQEDNEHHQTSRRRASQDATQYVLLSAIAREWICICIGNLVQAFHGAQAQAYNTGVHECLITLQQDDEDPNVRAAATYALGNILEHVSLPSTNSNPSSSMTSSLSRGRLQPTPQPPITTAMAPTVSIAPISLGPQAFSNTRPPTATALPPALSAGMLSSQGQLQPQAQQPQQMFLPSAMPASGMPVAPALAQLQPTPVVTQAPASGALAAAMARGALAPTQQQLHSIQVPGGQQGLTAPHPTPLSQQQLQARAPGLTAVPAPMLSPQPTLPQAAPTSQHPPAGVPLVGVGAHLGRPQPQQLMRATSGPQLGQQQGSLFHPQQRATNVVPSMGGYLGPTAGQPIGMMAPPPPVGMPIIGSPLGIGASAVGSPIMAMKQMRVSPQQQQQQQQQQRRRPTVYEDRRRIEFDLKVMESMMKVLADGSAMVRYEVIMAMSNFVEKYLQAILVIAEDATRIMDTFRLGNISEDQEEGANDASNSHSRGTRKRVVSLPQGVNQMIMERFEKCWKALRSIQHDDPHPNVSMAANKIVRVVHETLYDMRMEIDSRTKDRSHIEGGLTGIQEEGETGNDGMERVKSDAHISLASPDQRGNISIGVPQSDGPTNRLPKIKPKPYPLRRSNSEAAGVNFPSVSVGNAKSVASLAMPGRNLMDRVKAENLLPKSEFYIWKKSRFRPDYDDEDVQDGEEFDPLDPLGAARNYQYRRNAIVRDDGNKLGNHFLGLKPRRESQKKRIDMLLENTDDDEEDESDAILHSELKLQEKQLLKNKGGVNMTSMLKFHSYENALAVFDNQDYISIWDYETGSQKTSFKNGNPTGSRMTSAFWINESSSSLLFVGSDDGSARIWDGIVRSNGQISSQPPTLCSSFFAVPHMKAGQRSKSGLICEWQQTTGTLISGGNSRILRCWDMRAEKCSNSIEIETGDSCITALTTAWDEDNATTIQNNGFRGTGPEIVVAGLSDGTLKIFDIRMPKAGVSIATATMPHTSGNSKIRTIGTGGNRRRFASLNNKTFTEHGSWIVDVSFTSYGNQNEILSGCVGGDIRAWDIRMSSRSLRAIDVQRSPMTALAVHKKIPIAATGSHAQFIKVLTLEGETLQSAKFHEESLTGVKYDRIGPVSCLEFHKQKLVLAAGSTNALVSVYQSRRKPRV